jgi:hypothetical protein
MAHLQFTDVQARPTEFLDLTSLTLDEFQLLGPPFEAAFQAHLAVWRLDGKPRTARQCTVYKNCPLPTPEDRLFFVHYIPSCFSPFIFGIILALLIYQHLSGISTGKEIRYEARYIVFFARVTSLASRCGDW